MSNIYVIEFEVSKTVREKIEVSLEASSYEKAIESFKNDPDFLEPNVSEPIDDRIFDWKILRLVKEVSDA